MKVKFTVALVSISAPGKAKRAGIQVMVWLILFLTGSFMTRAQHNVLSVGAVQTLTITSGTMFSADSLVLLPTSNFTMASNAILETPVPVPGVPTSSINRVYYLNSPVTFTGLIQLYYQPSELNGNTESALKYMDSTTGSAWLIFGSSIVNTSSHFVQRPLSTRAFNGATASQSGILLYLKMLSFTGYWDGDHVALTWIAEQNDGSKSFTIESSPDEKNWQEVGVVPASLVEGQYKYGFNDYNAEFTTRLYRIKMTELSGQISYSSILKISKSGPTNNLYVVGKNNGATIYFTGNNLPKSVRVINSVGQITWRDNTGRNQYELNGLLPGIYFVQYELNGTIGVKQFIVP
jgi:hypothetical protein